MFEKLDLNKTMYFKDREPQTFKTALLELSEKLCINGDLNVLAIEEKVITALRNESISLTHGISSINFSHETVAAFHQWAMNIHNDNLDLPPGTRFPNNIVYDMISELRRNPKENINLRFCMEGFNARKISKGETPSLDFISTSLMLDVLSVQPKPLSPTGRDFLAKYDSTTAFAPVQQQLEIVMTEKLKGNLFDFLTTNKALDFSKAFNSETGANAYGLVESVAKGLSLLDSYPADALHADMETMVTDIKSKLTPVLQAYQDTKSSLPARLLAYWDASEFVCRAIVALQIAAAKDAKYQSALNEFMDNPVIADIYQRSLKGNFPGKARNDDIQNVEVTELFLQSDVSLAARSKQSLKA